MSGLEFIPFLLIIVVFWFLVVRPARKQQRKVAATQASLAMGSEVMLGSGVFGRVTGLDEETLMLEVAPGTSIKVARQAVVKVDVPAGPEAQHASPEPPAPAVDQPRQRPIEEPVDRPADEPGKPQH